MASASTIWRAISTDLGKAGTPGVELEISGCRPALAGSYGPARLASARPCHSGRCHDHCGGLPRVLRAWPLAWPSPSRPLGWQRLQGQGSALAEQATCKRRAEDTPLTLEGPARITCGVPARWPSGCDIFTAPGALGATVTAWPWCWRARQRDTAGTAGGPVTGGAVRGSRRAVGLASEGRGGSCRVTSAALSLLTACARPRCSRAGPSGPARRTCALEAVGRVVTTPD